MDTSGHDLPAGTRFQSRSGLRSGEIGRVLGAGGQGAVYDVSFDAGRFALKWYHDYYIDIDTGLYGRLAKAVERGAPDPRFLWPLELVQIPGQRSFGYIMPLRSDLYVGMRDLIAPPPQRVELSLAQRALVCRRIAQCFLQLHARGFCYQDINFGNLFLNPATADILICDNDNVNIDGAEASIYGTRKFMAPEVVRREVLPSTNTDLFSMAVMFFYVMFGWHPLDGKLEAETRILDADAELKLYGTQPLFIFDPINNANGPVAGMHDSLEYRWRSLSEELRDLFVRSFTTGNFTPSGRVLEYEWRSAFDSAAAAAYSCQQCGYENLLNRTSGETFLDSQCGYCVQDSKPPPALVVGRRLIALQDGLELNAHHLGETGDYAHLATITAHPQHPTVLGLRNESAETWRTEIPGYSATPIGPGKTIRLMQGLRVEIGKVRADVINPMDSLEGGDS